MGQASKWVNGNAAENYNSVVGDGTTYTRSPGGNAGSGGPNTPHRRRVESWDNDGPRIQMDELLILAAVWSHR